MLSITKTTTVTGTSRNESGVVIATMHCTVDEGGIKTKSENISNAQLYDENKEQVRADMDAFTEYCRTVEDGIEVAE